MYYSQTSKFSGGRAHRRGPSAPQGPEDSRTHSPASEPGRPQGLSGLAPQPNDSNKGEGSQASDSTHRRHRMDGVQTRARIESITLASSDDDDFHVSQLLEALVPTAVTPIGLEDSTLGCAVHMRPTRRAPVPPPTCELPRPGLARSQSVRSTATATSTSSGPMLPYLSPSPSPDTPHSVDSASRCGPITPHMTDTESTQSTRQSVDTASITSRMPILDGMHGLGLPSIPQEPNEFTFSFRDRDSKAPKSSSLNRSISLSRPPGSLSAYQASAIARRLDTFSPMSNIKSDLPTLDIRSSFSPSEGSQSLDWSLRTPSTSQYDPLTIQLDNSRRHSQVSGWLLSADTSSVSSGSTGISGKSDKRAIKEEKRL